MHNGGITVKFWDKPVFDKLDFTKIVIIILSDLEKDILGK
jgi:hypothetical protein